MPDAGLVRMRNAETGQRIWVDTSDGRTRQAYGAWAARQSRYLSDVFIKSGVDVVKIRTDQDYVKPLIGLFRKRSARR